MRRELERVNLAKYADRREWTLVLGSLLFVVLMSAGYYYNLTFVFAGTALVLAGIGAVLARRRRFMLENVADAVAHPSLICAVVGVLVGLTFLALLVFMAFKLILLPVSLLGLVGGLAVVGYGVIAFGFLVGRTVFGGGPFCA